MPVKIGDVIEPVAHDEKMFRKLLSKDKPERTLLVTGDNIESCRDVVMSGRWRVVPPEELEEKEDVLL